MDPYEILGVEPGADLATIRARYLDLVRRHHPDLFPPDSEARRRAESTMATVNAAWSELADPVRRARLDADRARRSGPGRSAGGGVAGAHTGFVPHDTGDDEPAFDPRHDVPLSGGGLPSWLRLSPPLLLVGGAGLFVVGGFTGILPLVAVAMGAMVAALVLFLVAPLVALTTSRRASTPSGGHP